MCHGNAQVTNSPRSNWVGSLTLNRVTVMTVKTAAAVVVMEMMVVIFCGWFGIWIRLDTGGVTYLGCHEMNDDVERVFLMFI